MAFLASPRLVDLVIGFAVAEAIALCLRQRRARSGPRPLHLALMVLPGLCLMFALRAALAGAAWPWVPAALTLALPAHLADLILRWRHGAATSIDRQ